MTADALLNILRVRLKEIFDLMRRLRELIARLEAAEFPGAPHAASHSDGGADEVNVTQLGGFPGGGTTFLRDDGVFAAAGAGTPSATVEPLDGVGDAGVSTDYSRGDHKHEDVNRPTDDEKAALVGTDGTPDATNPYVTNSDPRLIRVGLVAGGQVVWVADFDFIVSAALYYIAGVLYASPQTPITLDPADPTDPRIDVIAVDDQGDVIVITGTPAAQPAAPDVDPSSQLQLTFVLVPAGSTEPGGATTALVYAENAGSPTEWNWSSSGAGWNLASTNNPRTGTIDIEATNISSGAFIQGQIGAGTFDPNAYDHLVLYIRSKANWTNNRTMQIRLQNAGVVVGATLTIGNGLFGFDSSSTAAYQQIAIPIAQFAVPAGQVITQVRLTRAGGSTIGFYLDDVAFVSSGASQPGGGITQAEADARYAPLGPTFIVASADPVLPNERVLTAGTGIASIDLSTPGQAIINAAAASLVGTHYPLKFTVFMSDGSVIPTGLVRFTARIPPDGDGDIVAWHLHSEQTTNLEIDVLLNGASITDGNNPELSGAQDASDTNLADWDVVAVVEDDIIEIDILVNSASELFELQFSVLRT